MDKSIGALWITSNEKGEFWKGNIELSDGTKKNVIVFKNNYKKDNQPDLRIYESKPRQEKQEEFTVSSDDDLPF